MILLAIFIGLVLRLISINQSYWLDEGINIVFARSLGFKSLIFDYSLGDFHPPLYHIILRAWILLFNDSEIATRLPSVLFALASIYFVYLIVKKLYDTKTAVVSAILLATSPLHIYYSQEARMYMLAAFLTSVSVYFFLNVLENDNIRNWCGFIVSTALMLYSDYLPYLMLPTYVAFIIYRSRKAKKSLLKSFIPATILIFILILPWILIFPKQLSTGLSAAAQSPAWASVVGSFSVKDLALTFIKFTIGRISMQDKFAYAALMVPIAAFVLVLLAISLLRLNGKRSFLWFWLLLPVTLAFVISFFVPIFAYFRLLFVLPAFYILIASAITNLNWTVPTRVMLISFLALNLICSLAYLFNPKFHRENWKKATEFVVQNSDQNTEVFFESNFTIPPFDFYNKGRIHAVGILNSFRPDPEVVARNVASVSKNKNKIFLFQYLAPITDSQGVAYKSLGGQGFVNTKTTDFQGVGFVYEFTK